ncbi:MAG TPA: RluA family pseudouridine synthase [Caulifigura sp.]|nr:RluA family pseudouridine synthase [Caulifigura sp.]
MDDAETPPDLEAGPIELTVEARAHGWRLDHYLSRLYPNFSRALFQKAIADNCVLVNGLPAKASRRLRINDRLHVQLPKQPDSHLAPEDLPLNVLFEDEYLAVLNKAADMVTHPGKATYKGTLAAALQHHFDQLSDVAGSLRPGIVHRLDRDTTGVIVVAKDNQIHHRLSRQFERREVQKEYRAIVRGEVKEDTGLIHTWMKVHPKAREKMIVCEPDEKAREAVTTYNVIERFRGFSVMQLLPKTGRTHQLRVHMKHIKHPILADRLYGGAEKFLLSEVAGEGGGGSTVLIGRQALHAFRLTFRHPVTERMMTFEAPIPEDMEFTLAALRRHRGL